MKTPYILILLLVVVWAVPADLCAKRVDLGTPADNGYDLSVEVLSSEPGRTVLKVELAGFDLRPIDIDKTTYYEAVCRGEYNHATAGEPNLTTAMRSLIVPEKAVVSVRIVESDYQDFEHTPIAPSKGILVQTVDPASIPYDFGPTYKSDGWFPRDPAWNARSYILRDFHGVDIELSPFQYNAQLQTLRVYTSFVVEIIDDGSIVAEGSRAIRAVRAFTEIYDDHFINYQATVSKVAMLNEQGDMLIIAAEPHVDALAPFIEWKKQKGIDVTLLPVEPEVPVSHVQASIQDAYDNNPSLAFVLIVGDGDQIYAPIGGNSGYEGPCDPIYGRVAGDDDYPDLIVGRFSDHQAANINKMLQRGIWYERDLVDDGNVDWLNRSLGIASYEQASTPHMEDLVAFLEQYGYIVDALYETTSYMPPPQDVITALEDGRGYVNYAGHGSVGGWWTSQFGQTHIAQTQNTWKLPFIISSACLNGHYDFAECFAETWMKATDVNGDPKGAVATWMSVREGTFSGGHWGQSKVADLLMRKIRTSFGGLCFSAANVVILYGEVGQAEVWTVFGDPSLMVRTEVPEPLAANHSWFVDWDATSFSVAVTDPNTSQPVSGALCALYCGGTLHGRAYTDVNSMASIALSPDSPMFCHDATLTVTGFNRETIQSSIVVAHDLTVSIDPHEDTTKNCVENPLEPLGHWIECEIFSSHPVSGTPEIHYTTGEVGSFPPPAWTAMLLSDLGDNKWGRFLPLQHAGATMLFNITALNTNGDAYETPMDSLFVQAYGIDVAVADSAMAGYYENTLWYDLTVTNSGILDDTYALTVQDEDWPTTLYDSLGVTPISSTPVMHMDESYVVKVGIEVATDIVGSGDTLQVTATSVADGNYSGEVTLIAEGKGVTYPLPVADYFSEAFHDQMLWDIRDDDCPTSDEAEYGNFDCWPNALKLFGGIMSMCPSRILTSNPIDLSDNTQTYYLEYWVECGGASNVPEVGDDLVVEYQNDVGWWYTLATHERQLKPDHKFYKYRIALPPAACHDGFVLRFTNESTNNYGEFGSDDPPPLSQEETDVWYLENIHIGLEPLGIPTLVAPANNASSTDASPTLEWQAVAGASHYQVVIDEGLVISSTPSAFAETEDLSWTVSPGLPLGTAHWKVRARGEMTPWGDWSETRTYTRTYIVPPPSCPVLFVKSGEEMMELNPLLTECELSGYREVVTDYYHVDHDVTVTDGKLAFQLREMEDEITYLDDFRLLTVDHSPSTNVAVTVDGQIVLYEETVAPSGVTDQIGNDWTDALLSEDGTTFDAIEAGHIVVTFDVPASADVTAILPGARKALCNIWKSHAGSAREPSAARVDFQRGGEQLVEAPAIPPRVNPHTAAINIAPAVNAGDDLTLRISWNDNYSSDFVHLGVVSEEVPRVAEWSPLEPTIKAGDPITKTVSGVGERLILNKGDAVEFEFDLGFEAPAGQIRDFVILATGRYEPTDYAAHGLLPTEFALEPNYPNPFNPTTTISFSVPHTEHVTLEIFNVLGERVTKLVDRPMEAGYYSIEWHANEVSTGIYLYRLRAGEFTQSRKMMLLK